jgi:hypothetical protein
VYQNGVLMSGSLEALIDLLTPTISTYPDRAYVFAFILCSRLYLRPYELLGRVLQVSGWGCCSRWGCPGYSIKQLSGQGCCSYLGP